MLKITQPNFRVVLVAAATLSLFLAVTGVSAAKSDGIRRPLLPQSGSKFTTVNLVPDQDYQSNGLEQISFAIPFAKGELVSDSNILVTDINGQEIASYVKGTVPWRDQNGPLGSWQSVLIQFDYNFDCISQATVKIFYGDGVERSLNKNLAPYSKSEFDLPQGKGKALKVWPLFSSEYLTQTKVFGHLTPSELNTGYFSQVEDKIEIDFEEYKNADLSEFSSWGYDRVTTLYSLYIRRGQNGGLKYLREAYRSANIYHDYILGPEAGDLRGGFELKSSPTWVDIKYIFQRASAYHYLLTSDPLSIEKMEDMNWQLDRDFHIRYMEGYTPATHTLFTERHLNYYFEGQIYHYLITGNQSSRQKMNELARYILDFQDNPPDGMGHDGSWRHSQLDHDEGGTDDMLISSPWMMALLVNGSLLKYYDISHSQEVADSIVDAARYIDQFGLYRENDIAVMPYYLSSSINSDLNQRKGDETAHNFNMVALLAIAKSISSNDSYDDEINSLYYSWVDEGLTNPIRRYAWTFTNALQFLEYLPDFTPPSVGGVKFTRLEDTGLGSPKWGFDPTSADLDSDGDDDVILVGHWGKVEVYRNNGNSNFTKLQSVSDLLSSYFIILNGVSILDFDGDGFLDLVFTKDETPSVVYFKGDGNFGFSRAQMNFSESTVISAISWGDIDRDGDLDMAGENTRNSESAYLWKWDTSSSTFVKDVNFDGVPQGVKPSFEDYDNDDDLDLFIGTYGSNPRLHVYRNNGSGQFTDVTSDIGFDDIRTRTYDFNLADIDADGDTDVITLAKATSVYRNDNGIFIDVTDQSNLPNYQPQPFNGVATWADFNNDGLNDFILNIYNGLFGIFVNEGNYNYYLPVEYSDNKRLATFGDYDTDGDVDIVAQSTLNWDEMPSTYLLRNDYDENNKWMKIKIIDGLTSGQTAAGTKITVYKYNEPVPISHYQYKIGSRDDPEIYLGTKDNNYVDILITFPDGTERRLDDEKTGQTITVDGGK